MKVAVCLVKFLVWNLQKIETLQGVLQEVSDGAVQNLAKVVCMPPWVFVLIFWVRKSCQQQETVLSYILLFGFFLRRSIYTYLSIVYSIYIYTHIYYI